MAIISLTGSFPKTWRDKYCMFSFICGSSIIFNHLYRDDIDIDIEGWIS